MQLDDDPDPPWWSGHTRVPGVRTANLLPPVPAHPPLSSTPPPTTPATPAPARLPVPGRHAARRRRQVRVPWPETLRGRVELGNGQLAVVAVLVALGLGVTSWWVIRSDASSVGAAGTRQAGAPVGESASPLVPLDSGDPTAAGAPPGAAGPAGAGAEPTTSEGRITVDVAGRVRRPGIAVLDAGARVVDALEAAGGARRGVDLTALNLARPLVDGEQILVGLPAGAVAAPAPAAPGGTTPALVNLNTATEAELDTLPEVGPVTAAAILAWRDQHGGFAAVEELLEVDGIGEATLERIAPHVTV